MMKIMMLVQNVLTNLKYMYVMYVCMKEPKDNKRMNER